MLRTGTMVRLIALARGGAVLAAAAAPAAQAQAGPEPAARVDLIARTLIDVASLPSLSVAVLEGGRIVFARAWGWADLARRIPADTLTQYRIASVSKLVTATAAARLWQDGRLDPDAPASRHVSGFPGADTFTPRQLAGHLAGIGHYQREDRFRQDQHYPSVAAALATFAESPRVAPPGERYHYSTHGFTLLSAVVEGAAGTPFLDYVARAVFAPLGMWRSGPDVRAAPPPSMATLYARGPEGLAPVAQPEDPSYKWGGGGFISTPADLVRLARGHLEGFFADSIRARLWTSQRTSTGGETGVGFGWRVGTDAAGRRIVHHAGAMEGARSLLLLYPDERRAIAVTTNVLWNAPVELTGQALLEALLRPTPAAEPAPMDLEYTGAFDTVATRGFLRTAAGRGWVSTPAPLGRWFGPARADSLPLVRIGEDRWVVVTPAGAAVLRLTPGAGVLEGRMAWPARETWRFAARPRR